MTWVNSLSSLSVKGLVIIVSSLAALCDFGKLLYISHVRRRDDGNNPHTPIQPDSAFILLEY